MPGRKKIKVKGDFVGSAHETLHTIDTGTIKAKVTAGKIAVSKVFFDTDDLSDLPLGALTSTGTKTVHWTYTLDTGSAQVQALAAGEQVHETWKIKFASKGAKAVTKFVNV